MSRPAGSSWQVGPPQKPVFTGANSIPRAIVTDTINSYPVNDSSRFIIGQIVNASQYQFRNLTAYYRVHSDTLSDHGKIEVSVDRGHNWIDALDDMTYAFFDQAFYNKPILSGNSGGWKTFAMNLSPVCNAFNMQHGDTLLVRFTWISDGNQTNKDGLMYDDISLADKPNGIEESTKNMVYSTVYPNPASTQLHVASDTKFKQATIHLYSSLGVCTGCFSFINNESMKIKLNDYAAGLYYYRIMYDGGTAFSDGKFVVEK